MIKRFNALFPLWAIVFSTMAYIYPQIFSSFSSSISYLLIGIMLFMGMTLTPRDFLRAVQMPKVIIVGLCLQFFIMPLSALLISRLYGLSDELMIGMLLVGSVSGGTASNVITYLARGDVALYYDDNCFNTAKCISNPIADLYLCWTKFGYSPIGYAV